MRTVMLEPRVQYPVYAELTVGTTPVGLASSTPPLPDGTSRAYIACETGAVRWRADGTDPTSTKGHNIAVNDSVTFTNREYVDLLLAIKFVQVTVEAKLTITYDP